MLQLRDRVGPGDLTLIGPERFVARPRIWLEALSHTKATISVAPNFDTLDGVRGIDPDHLRKLARRFGLPPE